MIRYAIASSTLALFLSGCYSLQGTPQIINAGGVVNQEGNVSALSDNFRTNFRYDVDRSVANRTDTALSARMLESGFLLVRTNCDVFFRQMQRGQRLSRVSRDTIAPLITLLTGAIRLANFNTQASQTDALEILALGSGAALAGINIYDEHWLFGAENVIEVQDLTFSALSAHREIILGQPPMQFEAAVMHLLDHQRICTPANILRRTREAIAVSRVVPRTPANPSIGQRLNVMLLSADLGVSPDLTSEELASLSEALNSATTAARLAQLSPALARLGNTNPIVVKNNVASIDGARAGRIRTYAAARSVLLNWTVASAVRVASDNAVSPDDPILLAIGRVVGQTRPATVDEAQALWRIYVDTDVPPNTAEIAQLQTRLLGLGTFNPYVDGKLLDNPGFSADLLKTQLQKLSVDAQNQFRSGRAALTAQAAPTPGNPVAETVVQ
jgi:hypothetical protein